MRGVAVAVCALYIKAGNLQASRASAREQGAGRCVDTRYTANPRGGSWIEVEVLDMVTEPCENGMCVVVCRVSELAAASAQRTVARACAQAQHTEIFFNREISV